MRASVEELIDSYSIDSSTTRSCSNETLTCSNIFEHISTVSIYFTFLVGFELIFLYKLTYYGLSCNLCVFSLVLTRRRNKFASTGEVHEHQEARWGANDNMLCLVISLSSLEIKLVHKALTKQFSDMYIRLDVR